VNGVKKGMRKITIHGRRRRPVSQSNIVDVVEKYKYAVVNIEVVQEKKRSRTITVFTSPWEYPIAIPDQVEEQQLNIGSGFVFDARGYILTNEHVIHGASKIYVRFYGSEKPIKAKVVGTNYELDLAVLKVATSKPLPTLRFGRSEDIRVGEWVIAIGNPLGLDHTVTVGVVSAKERPMTIGDRNYPHLIQTDAAINRGNSGGPLINLKGEVVGINTAVSQSSQGIGFAIAVNVVKDTLKELMKTVRK
jgi:serine protease Do